MWSKGLREYGTSLRQSCQGIMPQLPSLWYEARPGQRHRTAPMQSRQSTNEIEPQLQTLIESNTPQISTKTPSMLRRKSHLEKLDVWGTLLGE